MIGRKLLISAFILVNVAAQVAQNVPSLPLPDLGRQALEQYGFWTGVNAYWRMFSPIHRMDWYWRTVVTDASGERELDTPPSVGRPGVGTTLADFREAKLLLNLWTRPPMQAAYLDHRCREERRSGRSPSSIRLELYTRPILPPAEAAARGDHRGGAWSSRVMAVWNCQ